MRVGLTNPLMALFPLYTYRAQQLNAPAPIVSGDELPRISPAHDTSWRPPIGSKYINRAPGRSARSVTRRGPANNVQRRTGEGEEGGEAPFGR